MSPCIHAARRAIQDRPNFPVWFRLRRVRNRCSKIPGRVAPWPSRFWGGAYRIAQVSLTSSEAQGCHELHTVRPIQRICVESKRSRERQVLIKLFWYSIATSGPTGLAGSVIGYSMDGFDLLIVSFMLTAISTDLALTST